MTHLLHIGIGERLSTEDALIDVQIGIVDRLTEKPVRGKEINVGFGSLLNGLVWTGIANALVGHLSGAATSASDLLLNNNLAAQGGSTVGIFAAFFVTDVVVREAMKSVLEWRRAKFMDKAAKWDSIQAMLDEDKGVWVVTRGSGVDDLPKTKMTALKAYNGNNVAVLSKAEFAAFEQKVAQGGGALKTYRLNKVSDCVSVTTKVGGKLQSIDGAAAVLVLKDNKVVREEWYDAGVRMPQVGMTPQDDHRSRELLQEWQISGSPEAKEAIIELARKELRFAANILERPDFLDGDTRPLVIQAHNHILSAKLALDQAFPDEEICTTMYWTAAACAPDEARDPMGFVTTTKEWLASAMEELDKFAQVTPAASPRM